MLGASSVRRSTAPTASSILTAEYNHGYPAVLKNAMDWTFVEWRRKPITFVGWGNVGGARAIEQLRRWRSSSRWRRCVTPCTSCPTSMIAGSGRRATRDDLSVFELLQPKLDLLIDDLLWWAKALTDARNASNRAP